EQRSCPSAATPASGGTHAARYGCGTTARLGHGLLRRGCHRQRSLGTGPRGAAFDTAPPEPMTIHDTLFKETCRRPAEAEALLRWVLGPDVFAGIPANRLRLHDPGLRSHHRPRTGDLLYTLPQPPPAPP